MPTLPRYVRFNFVGLLGATFQLATLAALNHLLPHHYLITSTAALELTVLHNLAWHRRYTWPDRTHSRLHQAIGFHLTNGLTSLLGTLALMPLLIQRAHLPVIVANAAAIVLCSLINFSLSDRWAFQSKPGKHPGGTTPAQRLFGFLLSCGLLCLATSSSQAQQATTPLPEEPAAAQPNMVPPSPSPKPPVPNATHEIPPSASYLNNMGYLCGAGASTSPIATKPTFGCGVGFTLVPFPVFVELGVTGPQANRSYLSGYLSLDINIPLAHRNVTYLPIAFLGYSRLFETGHAVDYGLALALPRPGKRTQDGTSLRLELRDAYTFSNPAQHNVFLRLGFMTYESD